MSLSRVIRSILRFVSHGKRMPIFLGLLAMLFVLWLQTNPPGIIANLIQRLEYLVYDQRMTVMPRLDKPAENKIVIVDLDERSLQAEGQYPWNRIKVGQLVERLRDAGALVIGFDITFPEPDRNIRDLLAPVDLSTLSDEFTATLERIELETDSDQYFANAMQSGVDVVLAINFNPQSSAAYNELPESIVEIDPELATRITVRNMSGFTGNLKVLQDAANGNGSMNQQPDEDGVVRRVPLVIRYGLELFPTLSLEMLRVYNFLETYELITQSYDDLEVVTAVRIGKGAGAFTIPTDGLAQVYVPYVGVSSLNNNAYFPYISATDVLRDTLTPLEREQLQNALVLVGTSAPGLGDIRAMPMQRIYPGVEVHANMLNALLSSTSTVEVESGVSSTESVFGTFQASQDRYFPYKPDWESGALVFVILVLGLAMTVGFPYLSAGIMASLAVGLLVGSIWVNFMFWEVYHLDFSLVLILLLIISISAMNMVYGFLSESQTRRAIKGMFDQYVPPAHIDEMLENPDNYSFEGESRELTVLFSDIRNFTGISEKLKANQLKKLLNDFFTPITGIIFEHSGTIDKYVGDMVMAFWGAPVRDPNHRVNAVNAALMMLEKVEDLKKEFAEIGFPEVNVGIGINSGMMNVGDMGSTYRRSYTVLGDAVNLSSRLENLTKFYGVKLLVGENTVKGLDQFMLRLVDKVKVKGKGRAVKCYEPLCLSEKAGMQLRVEVANWHKALDHYFAQEWDEAEALLQSLRRDAPECLLYEIYLSRVAHLRAEPPPENWDGSFAHEVK